LVQGVQGQQGLEVQALMAQTVCFQQSLRLGAVVAALGIALVVTKVMAPPVVRAVADAETTSEQVAQGRPGKVLLAVIQVPERTPEVVEAAVPQKVAAQEL